MAARNNMFLFAWICALVLPVALQLIAGAQEEVREYVGFYYGPFTLYFFFTMTYGFATVFVAYYQVSGYRKPASLDLLRITWLKPWEVVAGILLQLQAILVPPVIVFAIGFLVYLLALPEQAEQIRSFGWSAIFGGIIGTLFNQLLLCSIVMLGLLRNEARAVLPALLLVVGLNVLPIILLFWLEWPAWSYALLLTAVFATVMTAVVLRLGALWPAHAQPRRNA
jgi:hypothetical protein